jgi:hypothetical protein
MLRWLHLVVGTAGVVAFIGTGLFMHIRLDHLVGMADGPRALWRSGHIYILFAALLNVVLGLYLARSPSKVGRAIQSMGSVLLLASLGLFLYGFFVETPLALIARPMTRNGIFAAFGGVLLHAVGGMLRAGGRAHLRDDSGAGVTGAALYASSRDT